MNLVYIDVYLRAGVTFDFIFPALIFHAYLLIYVNRI